jgi:flavin reductase (DIM6/NTAB) family NADH-FMN oxidoreductase RutF
LFSVNILCQHQSDLSARFTGKRMNRFEGVAITFSAEGLPLLEGAAAHLRCRVAGVHKAGDHDIILGEVLSGEETTCSPLVFRKGVYGSFQRA